MSKNGKYLWKSGYSPIFGLFGFSGLIVAIGFLAFSLHDPADLTAIIFLGLGLIVFGVFAFFGTVNWIIEKKVNEDLIWLEYLKPFETEFNLCDDDNDPLISLHHNDVYVSRHHDEVYTVDLVTIALGVSIYIFQNKNDNAKNFCVIYNKYGLLNFQFKCFKRS